MSVVLDGNRAAATEALGRRTAITWDRVERGGSQVVSAIPSSSVQPARAPATWLILSHLYFDHQIREKMVFEVKIQFS
jgi:hypothetical protein